MRWSILGLASIVALVGCGGGGPSKKDVEQSRAEAAYRLGLRYYQDGNLRGAFAELSKATELDSKNAAYQNALGLVSFSLAQYERAEVAFRRALKLNPQLTDCHMNLGLVYSETGEYELAEQEYFQALQDPAFLTPEKVYVNWGLTRKKVGDLEGAEVKFRQAIDVSPRYPRAHYELARLLEETGSDDEALQEYLEAWKGMPDVPELNLKLGQLYLGLGNSAQAKIYLEKVISVAPGSTQAGQARDLLDDLSG